LRKEKIKYNKNTKMHKHAKTKIADDRTYHGAIDGKLCVA
jgi:hypothetical protein